MIKRTSTKKSIRNEIRHLALMVVLVALAFTFVFDAVYKITKEKQEAQDEFSTLAKITALNSQSALAFSDHKAALETLQALAPRDEILHAAIINDRDEILAVKTAPQAADVDEPISLAIKKISRAFVALFGIEPSQTVEAEVTLNGLVLGKVILTFDTSIIMHEVVATLGAAMMAIFIALLLSLILIRRMINHIMQPIDLLISSAKNIAWKGLYGQRVEKIEDDELGVLTEQFNLMLAEIEKRDQALYIKNERLEDEIAKRTRALVDNIEALKNSEARWKFAIEGAGDGVWDWNITTDDAQYSRRWKEMLGYEEHEVMPTNQEWADRVHPDDKSYVNHTMQNYLAGKSDVYVVEYRLRCKDGSYKWILGRGMVVARDSEGKPLRMIGTHTDITERKEAEHQLRIAATAFESFEGLMVTDANKVILRVNQAFTSITGYSAEELVGQNASSRKSGLQNAEFYQAMWESIDQTGKWSGELLNRRKNGEIYPEHLTITAVKDLNGQVTNYVGSSADISVAKAASEKIENLAFFDPLTKLPNRRLFADRLAQALANSTRSGSHGALLFLDLDHFKTLNDTLGHDYGDLLLKLVAERLTCCVREGDTVARLGGDEFVLLLENLSINNIEAANQIETISEKILSALNEPYHLRNHEYTITPSIGVTLFNNLQQDSQEDLLKHADIAMYQAKKAGRNTLRFFDPLMQEAINVRVDLERELQKAIDQEQFELYYQIQMNSAGKPFGAEALIRWQHPQRGMISPFNFIPVAEETGLIINIGQWVLNQACAQLQTWQQNPATKDLSLAVNVSAKQFLQPDFVKQVKSCVSRHDIDNTKLKLELTESMLVDNIEYIISTMNALGEMGIQFSLDDFGTGYSSLQYLKILPLNQLKIDQSFVRDLATDSSDKAIVLTIITMAESLGLNVIAEGVETEEQLTFLGEHGCKNYQGYYFSKPVPIEDFNRLL